MKRLICRLSIFVLLALLNPWSRLNSAEPARGDLVDKGMLVLRNGNVVQGEIWRTADHYRVRMVGGELQVRENQVEMFCHSFDEAYERRRANRVGSTADSHLEIARWCLRHGLLDYASRELLEARGIDPHHRKLAMLERQLQQALTLSVSRVETSSQADVSAPAEASLELIDRVPQESRALFVRRIQPMLVRSCATSGCHQSHGEGQFHINRSAVVGAGHPDTTRRNLASTLAQLDHSAPRQSSLLVHAQERHGDMGIGEEALSARQLRILIAWIEHLADANRPADVPWASRSDVVAVSPAGEIEPVRFDAPRPSVGNAESAESREEVADRRSIGKDPFDPELFNRRFSSRVKRSPDRATTDAKDP